MKYAYNLTFKMVLSATISLVLCNLLGVQYGTVAAVISILSIQSTKRQALKIGKDRILACTIAILLSCVVYGIFGNNFFVFAIFLFAFIPITTFLKIEIGMVAAVVLSNHIFVANKIHLALIFNEFLLMLIGIGVASIANLIMPSFDKQYIGDKIKIEELFKTILLRMSDSLITQSVKLDEEILIFELKSRIFEVEKIANSIINNKLLRHNSYYLDYIVMRKNQFVVIKKMRKHFEKFYMTYEQTIHIAEYTKRIALSMEESNDCVDLIQQLEELRSLFKSMPLPKTREEFENRAQLIQFLNDLEDFLEIKKNFVLNKKD